MDEINNNDIKNILFEISKEIILPKFQKLPKDEIKTKNNGGLVKSVDLAVENKLKKILLSLLPNSLFIGEESYFEKPKIIENYTKKKFCWTVDPIDGTAIFLLKIEKNLQ